MREMIDTRGRLISPEFISPHKKLPSLQLKTIQNKTVELDNLENTLMCVSASALGLESLSAVIREARNGGRDFLNIHLLHGYLRYSLFYYPLKRHLLSKPEGSDVILKGPLDSLRELGVLNTYGGYAFWISKSGNITWRSSGGLATEELEEFKANCVS